MPPKVFFFIIIFDTCLILIDDQLCLGCPFQRNKNLPKSSRETRSVKEVADPETSTPNGCTCNSLCGATIEDGFTKDWCTVEGKDSTTPYLTTKQPELH